MTTPTAEHAAELRTETWEALGTTVVVRHTGAASPEAIAAVKDELDAIDAAASRFRPESELSRVNALSSSLASNGLTMKASARTRRASSGLNGSSLPTVRRMGMSEVSGESLSRWQTSSPL